MDLPFHRFLLSLKGDAQRIPLLQVIYENRMVAAD
jgi:hypothetical protein